MAYVKPSTRADANSHVDPTFITAGTAVEATDSGFGVLQPEGYFEVLDALPLGKAVIRASVEAGSAGQTDVVDFATVDFVTDAETNDSEYVNLKADSLLDSDTDRA